MRRKERQRRARWKKEKGAFKDQYVSAHRRPRNRLRFARAAARPANRHRAVGDASPYGRNVGLCLVGDGVLDVPFFRPASRGKGRGATSVRSTTERQRYAWSAATFISFSGDLRSTLRLPPVLRGVKGTRPLVAFLWHQKPFLSANRKEMGFAVSRLPFLQRDIRYTFGCT